MPSLADSPKTYPLILIIGAAGCGKTTFATRFPKPLIIDVDRNLSGPIKMAKREKRSLDAIRFEHIHINAKGEPIPMMARAARLNEVLTAVAADPTVETIILDSSTSLEPVLKEEVNRQTGKPANSLMAGFVMWEQFAALWINLMMKLGDIPKTKIIIGHEQVEKDEMDTIQRYVYAVPGKSCDKIPILSSDVWRMTVEESTGVVPVTYKYMVTTVQNARSRNYKAGLDVPNKFEATQAEVDKIIAQIQ